MKENPVSRQRLCSRDYHVITWCIFLCTIVCYIERMGFSIAFTEAAERGRLSETLKGEVLSSFFIGYAGMQIPAGWLAARYGGSRVLAVSFALWGLISLLFTPGAVDTNNTDFMIACRIAIGASQGLFIPASHTLLARWIPVHERGRLVSMAMSGMYLGSALAMVGVPIIVVHLGPAAEFRCAGLIALSWLVLWLRVGSDPTDGDSQHLSSSVSDPDDAEKYGKGSQEHLIGNKEEHASFVRGGTARSSRSRSPLEGRSSIADVESVERIHEGSGESIPWGVMLLSPAIWAIIATNFAFHYATYVLMSWLPTYFHHLLGESLYEMGTIFKMVPYMMMFAASNAGGWLGAWAHVSAGMTIQASRKLVNTLGFGITVVSLLLMPRAKHWTEGVLYTTIALSSLGLSRGGWAVNHMDISPRHAGVVMGIANGAGTLAGLMGGWLTGRILELQGGTEERSAWSIAFGLVSFVCLLALVVFLWLARGDVLFR